MIKHVKENKKIAPKNSKNQIKLMQKNFGFFWNYRKYKKNIKNESKRWSFGFWGA